MITSHSMNFEHWGDDSDLVVSRAEQVWADVSQFDDGKGTPHFVPRRGVTRQGRACRIYIDLCPELCLDMTMATIQEFFFAIAERNNAKFRIERSKKADGTRTGTVCLDFMLDPCESPVRRAGYYRFTDRVDGYTVFQRVLKQPGQERPRGGQRRRPVA